MRCSTVLSPSPITLAVLAIFAMNYLFPLPAALAQRPGAERPGFSGMIQAGAAYLSTTSQLEADDDNERITSLDSDADAVDTWLPAILFDLNYRFPNGTALFFGTPLDTGGYGLTLGASHTLADKGKISLFGRYGIGGEVWKDPYLLNANREETDEDTFGGGLTYERILGTGLKLAYTYEKVDVDDDEIGALFDSLQRDGNIHDFGVSYSLNLGGGNILIPGFSYTMAEMDGDAQSHDGYEGSIRYIRAGRKWALNIALSYETAEYDAEHPIFDKTREEEIYGGVGILTWREPLGYAKWFMNFGLGAEFTDANIDFFDSDDYLSFVTVGYDF